MLNSVWEKGKFIVVYSWRLRTKWYKLLSSNRYVQLTRGRSATESPKANVKAVAVIESKKATVETENESEEVSFLFSFLLSVYWNALK